MTPLLLFLLGCAVLRWHRDGRVQRADAAVAPHHGGAHGRGERLQPYLEDPLRLFIPARLLLGASLSCLGAARAGHRRRPAPASRC